jgi:glutamate-5-semialdehyde dehydrogenase
MSTVTTAHLECLRRARQASLTLAATDGAVRVAFLRALAEQLEAATAAILTANTDDLAQATASGLDAARHDRMRLDAGRIQQMADAARAIASQPDPLATIEDRGEQPSGIHVYRVRSPLGLIAMIYEARPNVTIEAAALAIFSGNAIVLRPGKEIARTAAVLGTLIQNALAAVQLPLSAVLVVDDPERQWFQSMLGAVGVIDLLIPRGGETLIHAVQTAARVPVLAHAQGVCHTYVHTDCDVPRAISVILNAKAQRPGVCNATEGLLIDRAIAPTLLSPLMDALTEAGATVHGSPELAALDARIHDDGDAFKGHEWLSLDLTMQAVSDVDEAIAYIQQWGSGHTEAILTRDETAARHFQRHVQASAVMWNTSTRFNDGGELGLGAEIGISTCRLHAWGPMGAEALTTQRWVIESAWATRQ